MQMETALQIYVRGLEHGQAAELKKCLDDADEETRRRQEEKTEARRREISQKLEKKVWGDKTGNAQMKPDTPVDANGVLPEDLDEITTAKDSVGNESPGEGIAKEGTAWTPEREDDYEQEKSSVVTKTKDSGTQASSKEYNPALTKIDVPVMATLEEGVPFIAIKTEDLPKRTSTREHMPQVAQEQHNALRAIALLEEDVSLIASKSENIPETASSKEDMPAIASKEEEMTKIAKEQRKDMSQMAKEQLYPFPAIATPEKSMPSKSSEIEDMPKIASQTKDWPEIPREQHNAMLAIAKKQRNAMLAIAKDHCNAKPGIATPKEEMPSIASERADIPVIASEKEDMPEIALAKDEMTVKESSREDKPAIAFEKKCMPAISRTSLVSTDIRTNYQNNHGNVGKNKDTNLIAQILPDKTGRENEQHVADFQTNPEYLCQILKKEVELERFNRREIEICNTNIQCIRDDITNINDEIDRLLQSRKTKEADLKINETRKGKTKRTWNKSKQNVSKLKKKLRTLSIELPLVKIDDIRGSEGQI